MSLWPKNRVLELEEVEVGFLSEEKPRPWIWALDEAMKQPHPGPVKTYTVTIPGLTKEQAEELCREWSGATMKEG